MFNKKLSNFKKLAKFLKSSSIFSTIVLFFLVVTILNILYFTVPSLIHNIDILLNTYIINIFYFLALFIDTSLYAEYTFFGWKLGFMSDIENTTNTDGEDSIAFMNDGIEIRLQERFYFLDWVLANPFEFTLSVLAIYTLNKLFKKLRGKISLNIFYKKK